MEETSGIWTHTFCTECSELYVHRRAGHCWRSGSYLHSVQQRLRIWNCTLDLSNGKKDLRNNDQPLLSATAPSLLTSWVILGLFLQQWRWQLTLYTPENRLFSVDANSSGKSRSIILWDDLVRQEESEKKDLPKVSGAEHRVKCFVAGKKGAHGTNIQMFSNEHYEFQWQSFYRKYIFLFLFIVQTFFGSFWKSVLVGLKLKLR